MRLVRLCTDRFRNLAPLELAVEAPYVVLHGPNAQGKTNVLEAVHLLATLKPLHGRRVRELIQFGTTEAAVSGTVSAGGIARTFGVGLAAGSRTAKLDGKTVSDLSEYFAHVRAIAFVPSDGQIVSGEPGKRRNWLDRGAFTVSPVHLDRVRTAKRVLEQKSAALKAPVFDAALADVLDAQLLVHGAALTEHRARLVATLAPHVQAMHDAIADGHGTVTLSLSAHAAGEDLAQRRVALQEKLQRSRPRERERRTTLVGPQYDDLDIRIDGKPARVYASRGQIRSVVLALKLAEMVAARERGEVPLFLIDDVSSELDAGRTARLVGLLTELDAQILATTTDPAPLLAALPKDRTQALQVHAGVLSQ